MLITAFCLSGYVSLYSGANNPSSTRVDKPVVDTLHYIASIEINGNKVTRDWIILREMMALPGDTIGQGELEELITNSRNNLLNTSLFNFVDIVMERDPQGQARIIVNVVERWYIWPIPILKIADRNFNVWWETKDFSRLNYGFYVDWRNFRGRRENLITRLQFGYDQLYDFQYLVPYLNKKQTLGLGLGAGYHRNHEVAYITRNNRQDFYRSENGYARKDIFAFLQLQVRKNIFNTHLFEIWYYNHAFADSLVILNPGYSTDQQTAIDYFSLHYKYKSDHRDFAPYPLKGYYFDVEAFKFGLGIEGDHTPDVFYVLTAFRKFWQLTPAIYYAIGVNGKISAGGEQPYFLMKAIGYGRDIVRSYEYYVVDGNHFGIFKSNLKIALLRKPQSQFRFIRNEKFGKFHYAFYSNLFLDMGYAYDPYRAPELENTLQNEFLMGFGVGIDFVTYYDIVLRFEYSVNRMWEDGFFIHFNAPI